MKDYIKIVEGWAEDPWMPHEDYTKCGLCWKQKIQSDISKEFLETNQEVSTEDLNQILDETNKQWHKTPLYIRVKNMMKMGKTLNEITEELSKEGIEI